tara:strand:- start:76 stop:222 length:147 start_codon:yes stop_codon:yes gene_type:complete
MDKVSSKQRNTLQYAVITGTITAALTLAASCNLVRKGILEILKRIAPV